MGGLWIKVGQNWNALSSVKAPGKWAQWLHLKNFTKLFENIEFSQSSWVVFLWKVLVQKLLRLVSHSASSNSRECDGGVDTMPTQLHADTHFSLVTRTTAHASHLSCGSSVTKGQRLRFILRHVFALSSSFTLVTSRLLCPHHQHLLLNLPRPPRPQHGAGVNPQAHPLVGGSLADPTRLHTQEWWEILEHRKLELEGFLYFYSWRRSPIDATFSVESEWCLEGRVSWRIPKWYEIREYRESILLKWYMNSLKKFWVWNAWDIHHHHERDQCWQMMRRSSGRRQEYLSTLILFYVLVRRKKVQEQQKSGKANLKTLRCIHHIKMQWESVEKQLNSSGKNSKIFQDCSFFKRSRKSWYRRTSNRRNQIIFVSMFNDILWKSDESELHLKRWESQRLREAVPSRTLDVSWSRLRDDMVRRFSRTTTQRNKTTLFSQTSVLRIDELSNEDKTKVPFTSIENPRTRNSCFRRFILQLSSVSTEQRRTGVLSSTWRMKRKDLMQFLWTVKCWLLWSQKK